MSTSKLISILVVNYNSTKFLNILIKSLKKIDKIIQEIIIIDNNSNDLSLLKTNNKKIKLIINKKNFGFTKAVNQGIKSSKNKNILLLNPDTELIDKSIIKMHKIINNDQKIGAIGGKILSSINNKNLMTANSKPTFFTGLFEFTNLKKIFPNNKYSKKFWIETNKSLIKKNIVEADSLCGAFIIFRKKINNKLNLFDERFFMYMEDIDFGLHIKKMGYKVIFYKLAKIKHISGGSNKSKYKIVLKHWYLSRKKFFLKHEGLILGGILYIVFSLEEFFLKNYHHIKHEPTE